MKSQPATHVLVIGYVWPEPRSSAAGGHMMQILESFLAQGWAITFSSPAAIGEHKADLEELGIRECAIELNNCSFDDFIRELAPDIVLFDRFMMEERFGWRVEKHCPDALRVLETSDLQSLRDARQQRLKDYLKQQPHADDFSPVFAPALDEEFQRMADTDLAKREIAAIYRCDISLMISDVEIQLLTEQFKVPAALLHWCPLMIDAPSEGFIPYEDRAHFLSIGNFRHAPNWDAVLWMKNSLWPLIRQQLPGAQLHIYGAYTPPQGHRAAQSGPGFSCDELGRGRPASDVGCAHLPGPVALRCRDQGQAGRWHALRHPEHYHPYRRRRHDRRAALARDGRPERHGPGRRRSGAIRRSASLDRGPGQWPCAAGPSLCPAGPRARTG